MAVERDRGYAWVALGAMFFLILLFAPSYAALGIFMVEFLSYFHESNKKSITMIGGINMFVGNIASILAGPLLKKFGCRPVLVASALLLSASCFISGWVSTLPVLYAFFGVFSGIGFYFFYTVAIVSIQHWFDKRRSLANGIFMTGHCVGIFIWPPITRWLIDLYCWQGALIILGGIYLNGLVSAALLRKAPVVEKTLETSTAVDEEDVTNLSARTVGVICKKFGFFAVFLIGVVLQQLGHMNMFVYTPARAEELHIDPQKTSYLISVIGIVGLVARPTAGWIADRPQVNRTVMYGTAVALNGASSMLSTQFKNFSLLLITSVAFGIFSSGYIGILGAVLVDIAGLANIEIATGLFLGTSGIGNLLVHQIAGVILDLNVSSNTLFWVLGLAQVIGGILIISIPFVQRRCTKINKDNKRKSRTIPDSMKDVVVVECNNLHINDMYHPDHIKDYN